MKTPRESLIPNSTQVPNVLMDLVMPRIPAAHERCLRYICRRTFGFGKKSDRVGLTQFVRGIRSGDTGEHLDYGTGLSLSTVREALDDLEYSGLVAVDRSRSGKSNGYRIMLEIDIEAAVRKCERAWKARNLQKKDRRENPRQGSLFSTDTPAAMRQGPCRTGSRPPAAVATIQNKVETKYQNKVAAGAAPNRFDQFTDWYADLATRTRHLKLPLKVTAAGKRNLGRFLQAKKPSWELMEQLALYFLANHRWKAMSPGLETFLSAGVMNGLLNDASNQEAFWKDIEAFTELWLRKKPTAAHEEITRSVRALIAGMKVPATVLPE